MVVANEARSDELAIIIKYQTSASIIIVFLIIKNAHRVSRILPDFICKNNRFLACSVSFWETRTVTMFGEHGIMAHIT